MTLYKNGRQLPVGTRNDFQEIAQEAQKEAKKNSVSLKERRIFDFIEQLRYNGFLGFVLAAFSN